MPSPFFAKDVLSSKELHISHSSLATLESCFNKFAFSKFYPRRARDRELAPEVGHCLHTGYQSYLVNKNRDKAIYDMMMRYPFDLNEDPYNFRSVEACYATLEEMINSGHFLEYSIASVKLPDKTIKQAVEVPFSILLKGLSASKQVHIPIYYDGYIDAILYDDLRDKYIVIDIKTTRFQLNDYTPEYFFSNQMLPYALILEAVLGHPLHSLDVEYMIVYVDIAKPKITKLPFTKDKEDISDWGRSMLFKMQALQAFFDMEWFPRSEKACVSFKKVCPFFQICQNRDPENIYKFLTFGEALIEDPDKFKVNPWFKLELELAA